MVSGAGTGAGGGTAATGRGQALAITRAATSGANPPAATPGVAAGGFAPLVAAAGHRQGLAAPAVPAVEPPAPVPAPLTTHDSRRESLRLVPPPFPQDVPPPPLPGNPAQFDLPPMATAPTEPSPTAEPLFADAGAHGDPAGEAPDQPLVFNTGDPTFPPPLPEDPNAPTQRLELSMTRRFITPDRAQPARSTRRTWLAYAGLGLGAALVVFMMVYRYFATVEPAPISVKVVVPSPTSVYRWWDATAKVQQTGGAPLTMPRDGKVAEVVPERDAFRGRRRAGDARERPSRSGAPSTTTSRASPTTSRCARP